TRRRAELAAKRRALPWLPIEKSYVFESPDGPVALGDLFAGKRQLLLQHFMFGPDWKEGCPGCSFVADHHDAALAHLRRRDVSVVAVSRAPIVALAAFKQRMGWQFPWVSSLGSDFNHDFGATVDGKEVPRTTAFFRSDAGEIFQTYTSFD